MGRILRTSAAILLILLGLLNFSLAAAHLEIAGGRGGLLVAGLLFLFLAALLLRRRRG
ncbi:MAG TPA: hypothetical protein VF813_07010 [Anaerolineaceae bacterium]